MKLPYDPAIPLLGIYPDKTLIQKDNMHHYIPSSTIHTNQDMETTDGWMKMWFIYTREYYSTIKKNNKK